MNRVIPYAIVQFFDYSSEGTPTKVVSYNMELDSSRESAMGWPGDNPQRSLRSMGRRAWRYLCEDKLTDFSLPKDLYFSTITLPFLEGHLFAKRTLNEEEFKILKNGMEEMAKEGGCTIFDE